MKIVFTYNTICIFNKVVYYLIFFIFFFFDFTLDIYGKSTNILMYHFFLLFLLYFNLFFF